METFYHVSASNLGRGQTVKPYGRGENFRTMFDFCSCLVEKDADKIPFVSVLEDFMNAKGLSFPNPYSLGTMLREVLAEQVRRTHFSDKPARIGSVFVFKNYPDAYRFQSDYRKEKGLIYRCESPARSVLTLDMAIITHARLSHSDCGTDFQAFKAAMMKYWAADPPMQYPETICADPVTIVGPAYLAYRYDPESGRFIDTIHAPPDDASGQPQLPGACTYETPVFEPGKTPVYKNGVWHNEEEEDFRMNSCVAPQPELYGLIGEALKGNDCVRALEYCRQLLQEAADPQIDALRKTLMNRIKDRNINENIRQFKASIHEPLPPREAIRRPEILIPCFNQGWLLGDALASLPDGVAVTVINDASTDDTAAHIDALRSRHAFRLLTNPANLNQWGSLNRAITLSENNLFIILNADDALARYAVPTILGVLERHPAVRMVGGDCWPFADAAVLAGNRELPAELPYSPSPRIFSPADALSFHHPNDINMTMSGCSFLRSAWQATGGFRDFDGRVCSFDDRDFQMRVCALFPVAVLQEKLAFYRVNSSVGRGRSL